MVAANEKKKKINQKIQEPPEPVKPNWGQISPLIKDISSQTQN